MSTQADILYGGEAGRMAKGRNGFLQQHGLSITRMGRDVFLQPISSRGHSEAARLVIPAEFLKPVLDALTDIEADLREVIL